MISKCDLPTLSHNINRKIYKQPWYKERLDTKFIKLNKRKASSKYLLGSNWLFLKDGLDDFRDGAPPKVKDGYIIRQEKGLKPNVYESKAPLCDVKQAASKNRFTKFEICFQKENIRNRHRQYFIENVENELLRHPLALYPHLWESMSAELFENVMEILDPEMQSDFGENVIPEETRIDDIESNPTPTDEPETLAVPEIEADDAADEFETILDKIPYKSLLVKESTRKSEKYSVLDKPVDDAHIRNVTKEFCEWVASLGGKDNNIDETHILSLFALGYEAKPVLSVPINVVELTDVPPELRAGISPQVAGQKKEDLQDGLAARKKTLWNFVGPRNAVRKMQFGAWYIPVKQWRLAGYGVSLVDPKDNRKRDLSDVKNKARLLDEDLAPLHGSKAFIEFVENKESCRKPEFLKRIKEIQEETLQREEQARINAEQMKIRKLIREQKGIVRPKKNHLQAKF